MNEIRLLGRKRKAAELICLCSQNGHEISLWYLNRNLLLTECDSQKNIILNINLKTIAIQDEHELITKFNQIAKREYFRLLKSIVDLDSEQEISIYQDETGILHLLNSKMSFEGQTEITHYTNSKKVSELEIKQTYEALEIEYLRLDKSPQEIDSPEFGLFSEQGVSL